MASIPVSIVKKGVLRHPWDAVPITLATIHGIALLALPYWPIVALGLWWNSNTVAHYAIHRPYFQSRWLNLTFSLFLSVLLGIPQTIWRDRHLAHHAGTHFRLRWRPQLIVEVASIGVLWTWLLLTFPQLWWWHYLPGYTLGMCLCYLHGHYEHACGTTSHYGFFYNWLFMNDGYHVEHHACPTAHWTELPLQVAPGAHVSRWPATLRWCECLGLNLLERAVLFAQPLRALLLMTHERAFRRLAPSLPPIHRICIVGGGLFPRTVLVCRRVFPQARLTVVDASAAHVAIAQGMVKDEVEFLKEWYDPSRHQGFDLLIIPLAFVGDRQRFYDSPPAPAVLVHDWIWRRGGVQGAIVSWLLCKRLNLVRS